MSRKYHGSTARRRSQSKFRRKLLKLLGFKDHEEKHGLYAVTTGELLSDARKQRSKRT